jgi:hypothetical protein
MRFKLPKPSTNKRKTLTKERQMKPTLWQFTLRVIRSGIMSRADAINALKCVLGSRDGYVRTRYPLA